MVRQILTDAGFVEGKTFKECRFLTPPRETYAVYNDSQSRRGSDDGNLLTEHNCSIEVYCYRPDPEAEKRLEDVFDRYAIAYDKAPRFWIQDENLYQIIYDIEYIRKD